jgi:DNA-binding beta-propeller fold protein YncE
MNRRTYGSAGRGRSILFLVLLGSAHALSGAAPGDTLVWPSPPDQPRIRFVQSLTSTEQLKQKKGFFEKLISIIGGSESAKNWFVQPVGVTVSPKGIVVVTDPGAHGIHLLNIGKKEYDFVGTTKFGAFKSPVGCAFDDDGNLYVTDSEAGRVIVFDDDLDPEKEITAGLHRPTGIQIAGGRIYVSDTGEHKIVVMTKDGSVISAFGQHGAGAGEFNYPTFIAVRESISVIDALNYRVQTFDLSGKFSSAFGQLGDVAGRFVSPKGISLDSDGNRYVTDALMDNMQIFNPAGQLLLIVGRKGKGDGEFMTPAGIFIDKHDRIYVVDGLNRRLEIFQYLK